MTTVWCVGCGDIGGGVALSLQAEGWSVLGLRRRPPADRAFPQAAFDVLAPRAERQQALAGLPAPDLVLYTVTPSERTESAYRAAYDTGLGQLLEVLPATVQRVFLVSSTGVYGQNAGEAVDESSPCESTGFSGQALLAGEERLRRSGLAHTIIRLSGIYGQDRQRNLHRLRAGVPVQRDPPAWTNRIHREDAIGFVSFLMRRYVAGHPLESLYIGTDNEPVPDWEVLSWLAGFLGLPAPQPGEGGGDQNKRCLNARLRASGYRLAYPDFRSGYAAAFAGLAGDEGR
jgi:nucleoside-diphosphate-sugar epimerase